MNNVSILQRQGRTHSAKVRFQTGHMQGSVYAGQHSKYTTKQEIKTRARFAQLGPSKSYPSPHVAIEKAVSLTSASKVLRSISH